MMDDAPDTMREALRLVRKGDLMAATELLKRTPATAGAASSRTHPDATDDTVAAFRRLGSRPFAAPGAIGRLAKKLGRAPVGAALSHLHPAPAPDTDVAAGGELRHLVHTEPAGTLHYDLYVPSGYTGAAVPLVVMLHGGKQDGRDFAAGTRMNNHAERKLRGFVVTLSTAVTAAGGIRFTRR